VSKKICREAGASKMTFYKYFANKTDLVRQIKDAWMEDAFLRFDEIKALDLPFPEKIQIMTQWKNRIFRQDQRPIH
jgi:AcrR family transcriptional regulator